jgi:MFS family permease
MRSSLPLNQATVVARAEPAPRLWTSTYVLVCSSTLLASAHQGLLGPIVPMYIDSLGGSALMTGLALVLFSIVSVVARPFMGHWADGWSTRGVMALGAVLLAAMAFAHLVPLIVVVLVAGAIRGGGWGAVNTGASTLLAHAAPRERRGEASSYFSLVQAAAHGIFPALGVWLVTAPGLEFRAAFVLAGLLALGALAATYGIRPAPDREAANSAGAAVGRSAASGFAIYDKSVLLPAFLLLCVTLTHPGSLSYLPLFARSNGIQHLEWFYVAMTACSIAVMTLGAGMFDRVPRPASMILGFVMSIAGTVLLMTSTSLTQLIVAAPVLGFGQAIILPNTLALAIETADPERRGAAMGTYTAAFSTGQGIGAVMAGALADLGGFGTMYSASVVALMVGLVVAVSRRSAIARRITAPAKEGEPWSHCD